MTRTLPAALLTLACLSPADRCPAAGFIKFDGVDGESTDSGHQDWSDLTAFVVEFDGGGSSSPTLAVRFSMDADKSYPLLVDGLGRGTHYRTIEVDMTDSSNDPLFSYELADALLTDLSVVHAADGSARLVGALETLELTLVHVPTTTTTLWDYGGVVAGTVPLPGDFDHDGDADADDYSKWRRTYGATMANLGGGADANADGRIDAADYTVWRDHYTGPNLLGPATAAAPEPAAGLLLAFSIVAIRRSPRAA